MTGRGHLVAGRTIRPLTDLAEARFDTPEILKALNLASRALAELKGVVATIPNQGILINTLGLQEAKDSSAIESIVTTQDELYQDAAFPASLGNPAAKEVQRYREALHHGFTLVRGQGLLTLNHIIEMQTVLEPSKPGIRKLPGTALKDGTGAVVYLPPQDHGEVMRLMADLERFINDPAASALDPIIRMALIHHQFESIHPFLDGNGRTGRIVNILYLMKEDLLDIPVLYLSRYLLRSKAEYYRLLQEVRDRDAWEEWVLYVLTGVEATARETITTVRAIKEALLEVKRLVRERYKFYSQDLINNLFAHPYTKIQFVQDDLGVGRETASRYLNELTKGGILSKVKKGRSVYYINTRLFAILAGESPTGPTTSGGTNG